ncbi:unnamed protein product [Dimorphilus gyrociliatus]|uniref:LysM domain-containing protein n=1 Tax=Dimorphilus gyrociliatus TaxID=2664684 RepID=A0A7I8VGB3_9ANNE|nr:unnamed protein product [Dimorphilus gyrociliatus]
MAGFLKRSYTGGKKVKTVKGLHYTSKAKHTKEKESVYTFPNPAFDDDDDDNDDENIKLTSRGHHESKTKLPKQKQLIMIIPVKKDDTLQNLALKYRRPVAEIKRVNNLQKDQDFYALTHIKVPILEDGVVSELVEDDSQVKIINEDEVNVGLKECDDPDMIVKTISIKDYCTPSEEARKFMVEMDRDISSIVKKTENSRKEHLNDVINMLTAPSIQPLKKDWFHWSDCRCSWSSIIILITFFVLVPAIFYLIFRCKWSNGSIECKFH